MGCGPVYTHYPRRSKCRLARVARLGEHGLVHRIHTSNVARSSLESYQATQCVNLCMDAAPVDVVLRDVPWTIPALGPPDPHDPSPRNDHRAQAMSVGRVHRCGLCHSQEIAVADGEQDSP